MIYNPDWFASFPWGRREPASWANNVTLVSIASRAGWTATMEVGIGQYLTGIYLFGHYAKEKATRHVAVDVSQTNLGRARQVVKHFDLPVDIIDCDSKALTWGRRMQLIYVDGGHSYEQVVGDIGNLAKWIARSGLMIFDDYGKQHNGVKQAVDELFGLTYSKQFEMMTWPAQGWALWRRL